MADKKLQNNAEMADKQETVAKEGDADYSLSQDTRWRTSSFTEPGRVVLIAVDASDFAKYAFQFYVDNIHKADDLVVLTHCPEAPKLPTFSFKSGINIPVEEWKKVVDDANARSRSLEEHFEYECINKKIRYTIRGESMKKPGEGICRIAHDVHADLIVMGSRGLSTVKRALLGSVSDYVVRNADLPTLIVPMKKAGGAATPSK